MAGMVVKNNLSALSTLNVLNANQTRLSKSLKKVSSGMRINSAADDASGYAISERMRAQIRSLDQANRNTQNGSSMLKVAEGAVGSTVELLKTLKEKVINAANDTNTDEDRATIQKELDQSIDQINDNANVTYNGKYLVDGSKNSQGSATFTALTNKSLSTSTTRSSALTKLKSRSDESLGILSSDRVTVSYVQQGKTFTTTFTVGTNSLQGIFVKAEAIEGATSTFANNSNLSAASAELYPTVPTVEALAERERELKAARDTAKSKMDDAEVVYNRAKGDYNTKKGEASASLGNVGTAFSNVGTIDPSTGPFHSAYRTTWGSSQVQSEYSSWMKSASMPNPNDVQNGSGAYGNFGAFVASGTVYGPSVPQAKSFNDAWTDYGTKYTAYTSAKSDMDDAFSAYNAKRSAYIDAQNAYDAEFGPYVVDTQYLGLDKNGNLLSTPTHDKAITVTAYGSGKEGQISGLTISVSDSQGNIKKSVNAVLDDFRETIRAENESKNDNALVLQTGTKANQAIKIALTDMRSEALGLQGSDGSTLNIGNQKNANAAINVLDNAIQKALDEQTKIGSIQSRLEYTAANLTTASENVQASESAIRDADMAKEMTEYARNNVLMQAAQYMLAQANQNSSSVLGLLQ